MNSQFPAGFDKTALVSEWADGCGRPVGWLSLDEGDYSPALLMQNRLAD